MEYKLVRVDAIEPCKVSLTVGSHFIGRGKFLDCNDHRVSRNHAELIVTTDSVTLKSLHQNPCFYKKKSSKDTIIFSHPDSHVLSNGDQFGLIPDRFWYEVIYCLGDSPTDIIEGVQTEQKASNAQYKCMEKENQEITINEDSNTNSYDHEEQDKTNSNDSVLGKRSASPSLLPQENASSPAKDKSETPPAEIPEDMDITSIDQLFETIDQVIESTSQQDESRDQPIETTNQAVTPSKRAHSQETSPCDIKRVKTEPEDPPAKESDGTKTADQPIKTETTSPEDVKPGPSNDRGDSSTNGNMNPTAPQSHTIPPNKPLRERCMYGANCYRRNPQHKVTFSHPCDDDWGSGVRGECPWGAQCLRTDPRHWSDHNHPPGTMPWPRNRPGKRQRIQSSSSPDSHSEEETSLIVTGKRTRKPVVNQGWSASEDDEDPYNVTDESDEWEPPNDLTSQEFSQSQDI